MNWKKVVFGTWSWKRPFYSIGAIYLLLLLCALFGADALIFQPPRTLFEKPNAHFSSVRSSADETISIYYRPPLHGMPVILWSHGNAEDLRTVHTMMDDFHSLGYGMLAYDYPGYGLSSGRKSEEGTYRAINAAYQHLTQSLNHPPNRIILLGQSVGSGPTCYLAENQSHAGVILIAPFLSAFRTAVPFPIFPGDRFPNLERIKKMSQPLLIIHGIDDRVISHSHGEELHRLCPAHHKCL
ncbi:MAG: alpha/beta hydrolase, partial [Verrucomicrobiaceae bacterium]